MKINKPNNEPTFYRRQQTWVVESTLWFGKVRLGSIAVQRAYVRFGGYVLTMDFGTN